MYACWCEPKPEKSRSNKVVRTWCLWCFSAQLHGLSINARKVKKKTSHRTEIKHTHIHTHTHLKWPPLPTGFRRRNRQFEVACSADNFLSTAQQHGRKNKPFPTPITQAQDSGTERENRKTASTTSTGGGHHRHRRKKTPHHNGAGAGWLNAQYT